MVKSADKSEIFYSKMEKFWSRSQDMMGKLSLKGRGLTVDSSPKNNQHHSNIKLYSVMYKPIKVIFLRKFKRVNCKCQSTGDDRRKCILIKLDYSYFQCSFKLSEKCNYRRLDITCQHEFLTIVQVDLSRVVKGLSCPHWCNLWHQY